MPVSSIFRHARSAREGREKDTEGEVERSAGCELARGGGVKLAAEAARG